MSKLVGSLVAAMLLQVSANPAHERFARYKAVEAYEVRPDILMMPRYSADGQVCEIALEKLHYSPDKIRLDASLSPKEISQVFDELVPADERGSKPKNVLEQGMDVIAGNGVVSDEEYQNISIQSYSNPAASTTGALTATLRWKNRKCQ